MKLKKSVAFAALCVSLFSLAAQAEEHPLGTIQGSGIDLKTSDHAIAGSIKDFVVWGFVDEATFSSQLIMRKDGQLIQATFKKQDDGQMGGRIFHEAGGKAFETSLYLVGVNKEESKLLLKINGKEVVVAIEGTYANGHFQNPVYTATVEGQIIRYAVVGEACYGFSFHLAALILGAYLH